MKKCIISLSFVVGLFGVAFAVYLFQPHTQQYRGDYRNYAVLIEETQSRLKTETVVFLFPLNTNADIQSRITACFEGWECTSLTIDKPYLFSSMANEANPILLKAARLAETAKVRVLR